jgi:hypothetical protein
VARIKAIKNDAPVEGRGAAAAYLPEARNARTTCVVSAYGVGISTQFFLGYRARPHDAHVAFNDVEKLRELIQAGFPQNTSNLCHTRIVAQLLICQPLGRSGGIAFEVPTQAFGRICRHCTKFQALEGLSIESDPPVATKQKNKKGASNTIAESARTISMIRFEVSPIGHGAVTETNRTSGSTLFTLAKLSMSGSPKIYVAIANKTAGNRSFQLVLIFVLLKAKR